MIRWGRAVCALGLVSVVWGATQFMAYVRACEAEYRAEVERQAELGWWA